MNAKTYPSDLTDEEWGWSKDLIPAANQRSTPGIERHTTWQGASAETPCHRPGAPHWLEGLPILHVERARRAQRTSALRPLGEGLYHSKRSEDHATRDY